jgi:hypothetical protein
VVCCRQVCPAVTLCLSLLAHPAAAPSSTAACNPCTQFYCIADAPSADVVWLSGSFNRLLHG